MLSFVLSFISKNTRSRGVLKNEVDDFNYRGALGSTLGLKSGQTGKPAAH